MTRLIEDILNFVPRIPEILLAFVVGYLLLQAALWFMRRSLTTFRLPRALISIISSLASAVLWLILLSDILRQAGLSNIAITLSGSLLVIGLAIANGANTLVSDVIAGLFLAKDPDFDIGYLVKIGDVEGIVESIDLRKTRVRTKSGSLMIFPNGALDKDKLEVIEKPVKHNLKKR